MDRGLLVAGEGLPGASAEQGQRKDKQDLKAGKLGLFKVIHTKCSCNSLGPQEGKLTEVTPLVGSRAST